MAQRTSSVAGEGSYLCLLSNEREVSMPNIKITDWLKKRAFFICKLQLFFPWPENFECSGRTICVCLVTREKFQCSI